jgi:hypothetical protein
VGSVAASTAGGRGRETLAADDDLVDPDIADPDLLVLDDGTRDTRAALGLPAPAEPGTGAPRPAPAAQAGSPAPWTATAGPPAHQDTARAADSWAGWRGEQDAAEQDAAEQDAAERGAAGAGAGGLVGEAASGVGEVRPVETDSEATVTIPAADAGTARPPRPPTYGGYGGEADLRTQRIAPLPFGPPPADQQPARAFRPQPNSPLDFQGERPPEDRRKRGLAALLVVVGLVVVVLVAGVLLVKGVVGGAGSDTSAGGGPTSSASSGPAPIPAGYTGYHGSGFSVGVPDGWPAETQRDGVVDVREPDSSRFLRLITADSTAPARDQLAAAEKQFAADPSYGSYRRVKLQKVAYRGLDAADWEFTFTLDGVARHVLYRGIVTGGRTYGLYLSTPAELWTKSTSVFQVAASTFRTS